MWRMHASLLILQDMFMHNHWQKMRGGPLEGKTWGPFPVSSLACSNLHLIERPGCFFGKGLHMAQAVEGIPFWRILFLLSFAAAGLLLCPLV